MCRPQLPRSRYLLCVLLVFVAPIVQASPTPSKKVLEFLSEPVVRILQAPTKVEIFRLDPYGLETRTSEISGYPIVSASHINDRTLGSKLAAVLLDEKTYSFNSVKLCGFAPGVAFRIWKNNEHVDVLVCFSCDELEIVYQPPADAGHSPETTQDENDARREDFDAARPVLVRLAKKVFPKDESIQALKLRGD